MSERSVQESGRAEFLRMAAEAFDRMLKEDQEQMITFEQMEDRALEVGGKLERWLLETRLMGAGQQTAKRTACCPKCQKMLALAPPEERAVLGRVGEVKFNRAKGYCGSCRKTFFPSGRAIETGR